MESDKHKMSCQDQTECSLNTYSKCPGSIGKYYLTYRKCIIKGDNHYAGRERTLKSQHSYAAVAYIILT